MVEVERSQAQVKRGGRGKRKIEIKRVEKMSSRYVTFSKRKTGLLKKAAELSALTGADVGVIVFSQGGKAYSFGSPSVDAAIASYLHCSGSPEDESIAEDCFERSKEKEATTEEFWWEKSTEEMGLEELLSFRGSLEEMRKKLSEKVEVMANQSSLEYFDDGSDDHSFETEILCLLGE